MAFDIGAALQAGATKQQIADELASTHNFNAGAARQAGATDDMIISELYERPTPKTFLEKAKDVATHTGKSLVGMAENAANQVTGLAAMANPIQAVSNVLGATGAEVVDAISNLGSKTDTKTLGDRVSHVGQVIRDNLALQTYQPQTESGKAQAEATANVLTAIPQAVDAIDQATGNKFKENLPNTYAVTQLAGELAPFAVAGKAIHGAYKKPANIPLTEAQRLANTEPPKTQTIVEPPPVQENPVQGKYGSQPAEPAPTETLRPTHDDLAGGIPATASVELQNTAPEVKPVVKGTPQEILDIRKQGNAEGKVVHVVGDAAYLIDPEAVQGIYGGTKAEAVNKAKLDLKAGGDAESKLLGYPEREGLTPEQTIDVAVTKQGDVVHNLNDMKAEKEAGNITWAAEGKPEEVTAKANEVADAIKRGDPNGQEEMRGRRQEVLDQPAGEQSPVITDAEKTTGITNAITDAERAADNLPPIDKTETKPLDVTHEEGKQLVDSGSFNLDTLKKISDKPRTLSDAENSALLHLKNQNRLAHDAVTNRLIEAQQARDVEAVRALTEERTSLEAARQLIDDVAKKAGTEWGRSGRSRQVEIAEDYSLVRNINRMRAATPGGEITPETRAKIEALTKQIEEATQKIAERDEQISRMQAEKAVKRIEKEEAYTRRKTRRVETKEVLAAEFDSLVKDLNKALNRVSSNPMLNPETIAILGEIAKNRVKAGITSATELVDSVYHAIDGAIEKRDIRDAISGYGKSFSMNQEANAKMLRELKAQMRLISSMEDVQGGEPPLRTGLQRDPMSDTVRQMQREVKQAMKENGVADKAARSPEDQWKTAMDAVKTRLKNQIADLSKQLETGEKTPKRKGLTYDEEATALRQQRDALKAQLAEIEGKPGMSYEQKLQSFKTRTENKITELEAKIAAGDTSRPPKRQPLELDEKGRELKAERERLKHTLDNMIRKEELKNRSAYEKGLDWFTKWRRAVILSGSGTLVKLTTAASTRMLITPLEEIIGAGLGKIPGLSTIAAKAPREGGINIAAEAKAFRQAFEKQSYKDMLSMAKSGTASLDLLYGKKHGIPDSALEFFGHLHGALKIIPKRAEFYRSLEKRAQHALREGKDIQDPVVQSTLAAEAYVDANRAIFMNDNMVTGAYRMVTRYLETKGAVGKTAATGLKILMPIVKVPTNFVKETATYAAGGANAAVRITNALIKGGLEKLSPEEADIIMRSLKKQGVGAAMITLGYLNADTIGGYYSGKRDPKDAKAGDLTIAGVSVPHMMLHTPFLEALQMGATLKRVQDQYGQKGREGDAIPAAVLATVGGLAKQVPFYEQPGRVVGAMKSYDSASKFGGDLLKSMVIPPDMNKATKALDPVPRKTGNILEQFQASTPIASRSLPPNWKKIDSMSYDERQKALEYLRNNR